MDETYLCPDVPPSKTEGRKGSREFLEEFGEKYPTVLLEEKGVCVELTKARRMKHLA